MRKTIAIIGALAGLAAGAWQARARSAGEPKKLFMDVHELGKGKVKAADVAGAHRKDLDTQDRHGVHYQAYWVAEGSGKIYCLGEGPSATAMSAVHKEAHGLVAKQVMAVVADNTNWKPRPGKRLFMDVHHLGPGKATAADVAAAHQRDLAVQAKHGARFLNYWFDADSGTIMCLCEASSAEDALAVHKEAHGLMPESIEEVIEGR
jgi:hypothetical protein